MAFPSGTDYAQSVMKPTIAFRDNELKATKPELDPLGLPKPRSGSFAVAFKMQSTRDYAVKCFTKEAHDRQERYAAISDFLQKANLKYTVGFVYLPGGVLATGKWWPLLKMDWVQGDTLGSYVQKNVNNPQALLSLAGRWVEMTQALAASGMAHGDLQHGNVMVMPDGQLKLIDYDGMYVPALAGRTSAEDGHRNYQHPLRSALDFGPYLDHFSEWVIYVALVVLSLDPTLWTKLDGGDECLLFRRADFDPSNSPALSVLEASKDERVRSLAEAFRTLLYFGSAQIPLIASSSLPAEPAAAAAPAAPAGASWIADHVPGAGAPSAPTPAAPAPPTDSSWILSMLGPAPAPARFSNVTSLEWLVLAVSLAAWPVFLQYGTSAAAAVLAALVACNAGFWALRYRQQEVTRKARESAARIAEQEQKIAATEAALRKLEQEKAASA